MSVGSPVESSPTEAHLNDLAARTLLEDAGGFIMAQIPEFETLSESERITVFQKAQDITPPIDSDEELEEARVLEVRARKELEDDGCPPCYPPDLDLPLRNPPEQYQAIIQYWKSVDDVVLCYQKLDWEKFRRLQARVRCRNRAFSNFVDEVRERRRRHGLGGDVRLLLNPGQQSRLDNWMEFQNRHLERLEQFEKERDRVKQELDDAQKMGGDMNTARPKLGPTRTEALKRRLEIIERDLDSHHVLLYWIEQRRLSMDPGYPMSIKEDSEGQDPAPMGVRRTSTRGRWTKQTEGRSVLGKIRVTKSKSKERNTRTSWIQKPKAPEFKPPIQDLGFILQSNTSQTAKHPKTRPRHIEVDWPLRQIHAKSVSKARRFAGINAKAPLGSRRRGAEQPRSLDLARQPTLQRAKSAPVRTTRSGRISRPPSRWAPESGLSLRLHSCCRDRASRCRDRILGGRRVCLQV